ncbi:MAG: cation:proton antiporter [Solirubrobacterales bacterium]|nr:cation:proton antiporter [Thermoleophilales bacterium]MCO5327993.1 cation:proton antiporter [Solirubrobacterales bacterium]
MASGDGSRRGRLTAFYVGLAIFTAVGLIVGFSLGSKDDPEEEVAGLYASDPPDACLGESFDVRQSGQFASIGNADDSAGGSVTIEDGHMTGTVDCLDGSSAEVDVQVGDGEISGTVGSGKIAATRTADAPPPEARNAVVPESVDGDYELSPPSLCLGSHLELEGDSGALEVHGSDSVHGELSYDNGALEGQVTCSDGSTRTLSGTASNRTLQLTLNPIASDPAGAEAAPERIEAAKQREFGLTIAAFFLALVVVMAAARLFGGLAVRIGQPRVMGEVVSGIILGPTVFGALAPQLQATVFPADLIPVLGVVANLGLVFYMFMVGIELDPAALKGRVGQAIAISNASVAFPLVLGILVAVPVYEVIGPDQGFAGFALFMGVAMSITAFPVLARILVERRMLSKPVGATAIASAAIDDVTAWFLIALATAVSTSGSGGEVLKTIALAVAFCAIMFLAVRPLIARVSGAYDEEGRIPAGWLAVLFAGVLLSAYATEEIGIALIFGAFVMGLIMPRRAELTEDVTGRMEDFVVIVLLPLFFAYTGLRTNIGLLDRPELWVLTGVLLVVAIVGKFFGAMIAARVSGIDWRGSAVLGTLMNTRGLTELIVLNLALEIGVISEALFAALVIMALVTTFMAGPMLKLLDPHNELGAPVEDAYAAAKTEAEALHPSLPTPERAILLAPQSEHGMVQLVQLGRVLATSEPRRELILARQVRPSRAASYGVRAGLQTDAKLLAQASAEVDAIRDGLTADGIAARSVAYISANPERDLAKVATADNIDLVLLDGRRPLLGDVVPGGEVSSMLRDAPSDVAALVAREGQSIEVGAEGKGILVPFGGSDHDWAALELGAWISAATGVPLSLFGAAGTDAETSDVSRLLGDASMLVQQFAGVSAAPLLSEPGRRAVMRSAAESSLVVVGLSADWRSEGLGATRTALAEVGGTPVLFVRRGSRPGTLAPASDVTNFGWSHTRLG